MHHGKLNGIAARNFSLTYTQIPFDMKKGVFILMTAFFFAMATFGFWYVSQKVINDQLRIIELKLTTVHLDP